MSRYEVVRCPCCGAEVGAEVTRRGTVLWLDYTCDCDLSQDEYDSMRQAARDANAQDRALGYDGERAPHAFPDEASFPTFHDQEEESE